MLPAEHRDDLAVDALDGGEEGMEVYKEFVAELPRHLKENGHVLCEIGGNSQCRKMKNALESLGLTVNTKYTLRAMVAALTPHRPIGLSYL